MATNSLNAATDQMVMFGALSRYHVSPTYFRANSVYSTTEVGVFAIFVG
jgi:hypothetical protein